jgi:hypothetical protein
MLFSIFSLEKYRIIISDYPLLKKPREKKGAGLMDAAPNASRKKTN